MSEFSKGPEAIVDSAPGAQVVTASTLCSLFSPSKQVQVMPLPERVVELRTGEV